MAENTQHKLDQIRPPRVQITYDVVVGDAIEHKELPFVVGIMADLSGMRAEEPPSVKDRSFVGIYMENIDDIMAHIKPNLNLSVENKLLNNKGKFKVNLNFETMDDFHPLNLLKQIPTLQSLYESRVNLKDLLSKMDGNDELEEMMKEIMNDLDMQDRLMNEIELDGNVFQETEITEITEEEFLDAKQTLEELPTIEIENDVNPEELFMSPYENEVPEDAAIENNNADDYKPTPLSVLKAESKDTKPAPKNDDDFF